VSSELKLYKLTINGITHTIQADEAYAKRYGLTEAKAAEKPANKARAPRNKQG